MIKGISAIMICISHIITNEYSPYIQFLRDGSIWLGISLFYTGFGLLNSYKTRENYLDNFFLKRL